MDKKTEKTGSIKGKFVISNDRGLHTRPATELVKCASRFRSQISLSHQRNCVNAKSLLGVLMLEAPKGTKIKIEAIGEDAEEAVNSIVQLANECFYIKY